MKELFLNIFSSNQTWKKKIHSDFVWNPSNIPSWISLWQKHSTNESRDLHRWQCHRLSPLLSLGVRPWSTTGRRIPSCLLHFLFFASTVLRSPSPASITLIIFLWADADVLLRPSQRPSSNLLPFIQVHLSKDWRSLLLVLLGRAIFWSWGQVFLVALLQTNGDRYFVHNKFFNFKWNLSDLLNQNRELGRVRLLKICMVSNCCFIFIVNDESSEDVKKKKKFLKGVFVSLFALWYIQIYAISG